MVMGVIISINHIIDNIEKEIMRINEHTSYKNIIIELNPIIFKKFNEKYINIIKIIGEKYNIGSSIKRKFKNGIIEKMNIIYNS